MYAIIRAWSDLRHFERFACSAFAAMLAISDRLCGESFFCLAMLARPAMMLIAVRSWASVSVIFVSMSRL